MFLTVSYVTGEQVAVGDRVLFGGAASGKIEVVCDAGSEAARLWEMSRGCVEYVLENGARFVVAADDIPKEELTLVRRGDVSHEQSRISWARYTTGDAIETGDFVVVGHPASGSVIRIFAQLELGSKAGPTGRVDVRSGSDTVHFLIHDAKLDNSIHFVGRAI